MIAARETYPKPDDAAWRLEQTIGALTLVGDGMAIPLEWCELTEEQTQAVRRALEAFDTAKMELAGAVMMLRRTSEGHAA